MIRLALTLGSIITTVATPVVAQVHHAPTKRTLSNLEKQRIRDRLVQHMIDQTGNFDPRYNNDQMIRDIVNSIPDAYYDRYFSSNSMNNHEFSLLAGDLLKEYNGAVRTNVAGQSLSVYDKTLLNMFSEIPETQLKINSLERLRDELQMAGRYAEASNIDQMIREYRYGLSDLSYRIARAYENGGHTDLSWLERQYSTFKYDLDRQFYQGGDFYKYTAVLDHIKAHINDFNYDGGRIPDLHNLVAATKLAAALHLENMKDYQKIIMWVSGAFSLILSVWIFMLFIRKRKSKMSRGLKALLLSLSIIMLLVGAAFGVMPFLGGM